MSRSGGVTSPAAEWPDVNDRVRVRLELPEHLGGDELDLLTRVEDVREGRLVVAAPTFAGDLHVARPGLELLTSWATDRGQCRQEFVLAAAVRGDVPCWELEAVGEVALDQRRRFVRVPVVGRGRLRVVAPREVRPLVGGQPVGEQPVGPHEGPAGGLQENASAADDSRERTGPDDGSAGELSSAVHLVDLSEGGACIRSTGTPWLTTGRQVVLTFEVDGGEVDQFADVLRVTRSAGPAALEASTQVFDVVLAFVEPVVAADRVRRHVMRIQIENRRRGER